MKKNQEKNEKTCFFTLFSLKILQNVHFSSNLLNFFEIRLLILVQIIPSRPIFAKSKKFPQKWFLILMLPQNCLRPLTTIVSKCVLNSRDLKISKLPILSFKTYFFSPTASQIFFKKEYQRKSEILDFF
jgi:hypothetical protein